MRKETSTPSIIGTGEDRIVWEIARLGVLFDFGSELVRLDFFQKGELLLTVEWVMETGADTIEDTGQPPRSFLFEAEVIGEERP